ncbi:hypothetical protein URH17368_0877 [Alicyclobacillus hesperidum URH17-3-68]|uniref:hypothetical protein n=1 Tax=Alicyclobacillus hesperidum TaxID=89784 RepID=UPI000281B871|nr:hypothetical protein [Alicyclobacillus hesperidum]EJY56444.1 hypothetical protein URH17368_0877 [Alicyclobacillus hesperidum URH17-3-68]
MKKSNRWLWAVVITVFGLCILGALLFTSPPALADTTPSSSTVNQILPTEQQAGVSTDVTPTYRTYPSDRYAFDLGYSLVTWEWGGLKPSLNDPIPFLGNAIASWIFIGSGFVTRFGIFLAELGFHTQLVNDQLAAVSPLLVGLRQSLFGRFLPFALIALGFWAVKKGMVDHQPARVWSGLLASVCVLAGGLFFMANSGQDIRFLSNTMDELSQVTMGALSQPFQQIEGTSSLSPSQAADTELVVTSNQVWDLLVTRPWMIGEFNRTEGQPVSVSPAEATAIDKAAASDNVSLSVSPGDDWTVLMRSYPEGSEQRNILATTLGDPSIDHTGHEDMPDVLGPGSVAPRMVIALFSLVASLTFLLFTAVIGGMLVAAQEMALAIILICPIVFLIGVLPGRGFGLVRAWLGWLIGALGTKVVYGLYFGFTLLLADVVTKSVGLLILQQVLVSLLFFLAFLFRKRVLSAILSKVGAPTPHEMMRTSVVYVRDHWRDTASSASRTGDFARNIYRRFRPKAGNDDGDES